MITWKEYTDLKVNEMEKRVALALSALERADQHSRSNVAMWLSVASTVISVIAVVIAVRK